MPDYWAISKKSGPTLKPDWRYAAGRPAPILRLGGHGLRRIGIAGLQLDLDQGPNVDRIAAEVRAAKARLPWLDMVVLSELAVYGPSTQFAEPEDGPAERAFRALARETQLWLIPGSLFTRSATISSTPRR